MAALKNGVKVKLIQPEIVGEIIGGSFVDGEPKYLVEYKGADGELHQSSFASEVLEVIK